MLQLVPGMHRPRHNTSVRAAPDQFLGHLRVEVLHRLPTHAVDGVGQVVVLDVVEDFAVQRGYDFESAVGEGDGSEAAILTDLRAADLILGETDSEAVRKMTEGGVALLFGFGRGEKSFEVGGLGCLLCRL